MKKRKRLTSATLPAAKGMNKFEAHFVELLKDHDLSTAIDLQREWQKANGEYEGCVIDCNTPEQWKVEEKERERKRRNGTLWQSPYAGMTTEEILAVIEKNIRDYDKKHPERS